MTSLSSKFSRQMFLKNSLWFFLSFSTALLDINMKSVSSMIIVFSFSLQVTLQEQQDLCGNNSIYKRFSVNHSACKSSDDSSTCKKTNVSHFLKWSVLKINNVCDTTTDRSQWGGYPNNSGSTQQTSGTNCFRIRKQGIQISLCVWYVDDGMG
jgi:hypothetical protein